MSERWGWISGWAIPPEDFKRAVGVAYPDYVHEVLTPTAKSIELLQNMETQRLGAYSLGSLLLLQSLDQVRSDQEIFCLAPITGFCREMEHGGRTPSAVLANVQKRLNRDPLKAIQLFYRLAKLKRDPVSTLPYPLEDLVWGLEQLATQQVTRSSFPSVHVVIGRDDPLLEKEPLQIQFPEYRLAACGHDFQELLQEKF